MLARVCIRDGERGSERERGREREGMRREREREKCEFRKR